MNLKDINFKRLFWQFFRYGVVGILAFSTYYLINFILIKKMGFTANISIIYANIGGSVVNYLMNKRFTFKDNHSNIPAQIATFVLFNVIIYNLLCLLVLFLIQSKYKLVTDELYSTIAVAVIMMPINFIMAKLITFKRRVLK